MQLPRRAFVRLVTCSAVLPISSRITLADGYPNRPVHLVVGLAPGSASDIVARLICQALSERLHQTFVVDNRTGAGGTLATETVTRATPDGYTLVMSGSQDSVSANVYENLNFDFHRDITPIASVARGPLVLVVNPSFSARTLPEFIAYAKANSGKISFGSAGVGTVAQMAGELFKAMAGIEMLHVPYRGLAPALTDLIAGRVQAVFSTMPPGISYVRAGRLIALGVTSSTRFKSLPDVPSINDVLPGYEASIVLGLGAPNNTPVEAIDKLNKATNAVLADPNINGRLSDLGMVALPMTPTEYGKLQSDETEKWRKLIKVAGIKFK